MPISGPVLLLTLLHPLLSRRLTLKLSPHAR